jgi:HNH endonuclease
MQRQCYNCKKDISDEPALEGRSGLLCFPCKYRFDEAGGERFVVDLQRYQKELAVWEPQYKSRWQLHRKMCDWSDFGITLVSLCFFVFIICVGINGNLVMRFWPVLLTVSVLGIIIKMVFSVIAKQYSCPPPPAGPSEWKCPDSNPKIIIDSNYYVWDGDPECVQHANGYPPDWFERQYRCRKRDGHKCRLCGSSNNLHIHHVKPISFGGTHTLQNLITLCRQCHMSQTYYEHKRLVKYNKRAKRKYWVSGFNRADGVTVNGHMRRVGRRGKFWKRVHGSR